MKYDFYKTKNNLKSTLSINFACFYNFLRFLPEIWSLVNKLPNKFSRIYNFDKTQNYTTFCTLYKFSSTI